MYLEPFRSVCWESVYKSISYFADDSDKTVLYMHTTLESVDTLKSILENMNINCTIVIDTNILQNNEFKDLILNSSKIGSAISI